MRPVRDFTVRYYKQTLYDDLITVETRIEDLPTARITFHYDIFNENGNLLTNAETTLVFISKETGRPVPAPQSFLGALKPYFD